MDGVPEVISGSKDCPGIHLKQNTVLVDIEHWRSIYFHQFHAAHNGHFSQFFVQKYSNSEQKVAKNYQCVFKTGLLAF